MRLLAITGSLLLIGAVGWVTGTAPVRDVAWLADGLAGLAVVAVEVARSVRRRELGADVVALLALVGCVATREFFAAAVLAVMLATGRGLEGWAQRRAGRELSALVSRAPRTARRLCASGPQLVPVGDVAIGDVLLVASGEVVPVDGVLRAPATLDESALTGEPLPVERAPGEPVRSGVLNAGDAFEMAAGKRAADSAYADIVRLVTEAQQSAAPVTRLADRYAGWFVPVAVGAAALAGVLSASFVRAVAVLVVATPCPLLLAVPVAVVGGLSDAARRGVVVRGGGVLERLAAVNVVLFDKTGTLTAGRPVVQHVVTAPGQHDDEVLRLAAAADAHSAHVLARAVVAAAQSRGLVLPPAAAVVEHAGFGVEAMVAGERVQVGKAAWLAPPPVPTWLRRVQRRAALEDAALVLVRVGAPGSQGELAGALLVHDPLRPDAARTVRSLREAGVRRVVMVTGDRAEVAESVGRSLGVDDVLAERLPREKVDALRAEQQAGGVVAMVGDGINDAPALATADVGVAITESSGTAASEAADAVLLVDRLDRLAAAIVTARRATRLARQSAVVGMALSAVAMLVAAVGLLPASTGALSQEVIDAAAILNALRIIRAPRRPLLQGADAEIARTLHVEHAALRPDVERIRAAADAMSTENSGASLPAVRAAHDWLVHDLLPHERREEQELYPRLRALWGGAQATAAMSRTHLEIDHLASRLTRLLDELPRERGAEPPAALEPEDVVELRRLLYALHAVLTLHFAQEDEGVFPLLESESLTAVPV